MADNKKSVLLYCDIIHTVKELSNEEAGTLFKHYLEYINDLNPTPPDKLTQIVFEPIKQNLKRDLKKWENKSERNKGIALAGWEKRKDANACERIKTDAKHADKDTVTDTVTVKVKDISLTENSQKIYREFKHLKLTEKEFNQLVANGFTKLQIDDVLNSIENFRKNVNYTSLFLTACKWLEKDKVKIQNLPTNNIFNLGKKL